MKERRIIVLLSRDNHLLEKELENERYVRHDKIRFPELDGNNQPLHPTYHSTVVDGLLEISSFAEPIVIITHSEAIILGLRLAIIKNRLEAHGLEVNILGFNNKDWIIEFNNFARENIHVNDFWPNTNIVTEITKLHFQKLRLDRQ